MLSAAPARHAQPDLADYGSMVVMRSQLGREARSLSASIGACERRIHAPYGAGLERLGTCLSIPLHVAMMSSRFAPLMLASALERLKPGACMALAAGLTAGFSELGDSSYAWIADFQTLGTTGGARDRADASDLLQTTAQMIHLAGSPSWRAACHPRPYDASEHPGARARRHRPRAKLVITT